MEIDVVRQGNRGNKSQKIASELKSFAKSRVNVINPLAKEMEKAAKHIEWLELILTGISYADRNTIIKLGQKTKRQETMLLTRDIKLKKLGATNKLLEKKHLEQLAIRDKKHARELTLAKKLTVKQVHDIEKNFIKDLQTGFQKGNALSKARFEGMDSGASTVEIRNGTCATDRYDGGGWVQYIQR